MGVARYDPRKPCSLEELIRRADAMMYVEKRRKRRG
jgi:PleD family two-component response regulator